MKLIIVANRLPIKVSENNGKLEFETSEGGLATGLNSLDTIYEKHWIGWPGVCPKDKTTKKNITMEMVKMKMHPVFLSSSQYHDYYEGYSNSTLWPLCHYFYGYSAFQRNQWQAYKEVNQIFCNKVMEQVDDDSIVWVQDYQLMLLPNLLREKCPNLRIAYFHHIPFPSFELFSVMPNSSELLKGLLGAEFIAFHTLDYMRHFTKSVERILGFEFKLNEVMVDGRAVWVDALPMGINYELYSQAPSTEAVKDSVYKLKEQFGGNKVIISVDRLDYSKGIVHRLVGFETFLDQHPEYHGKVSLGMIIVPSRDKVIKYAEMKKHIDEKIGNINGKFSKVGWTPVNYFYHSFKFNDLVAMYKVADIALISPLRDGMNLVAKEYIAAKQDSPGVLILSKMAGASIELTDAILINPNDTDEIALAIQQALEMPEIEQKRRMKRLQERVSKYDVKRWASDFFKEWKEVIDRNLQINNKTLTKEGLAELFNRYSNSNKRLLVFDYDGTLVGFHNNPKDAYPTQEVKSLLTTLCQDDKNSIVINSGRDCNTLDSWLGDIKGLKLAAEHGAYYKDNEGWHKKSGTQKWDPKLLEIMRKFTCKTVNSHIEVKETAIVWHYREVVNEMGQFRARQMMRELIPICSAQNFQIINGNKVVEIKPNQYSKGTEIRRLIDEDNFDFIFAIGDDTTDEDMFREMPYDSFSIKVGNTCDDARYTLTRQKDVINLLYGLCVR